MQLPSTLQQAIATEVEKVPRQHLQKASEELSTRYRGQHALYMSQEAHRLAYLAVRLPATFAAICHVLQEVKGRVSSPLQSLLDLGAGPGSAMWAASEIFGLKKCTLIEQDAALVELGKRIASKSPLEEVRKASWQLGNLHNVDNLPVHDLVILSYAIGELEPSARARAISEAWKAAGTVLVVIEPGTPAGFQRILAIRNQLIELGGQMVAPCPHMSACPMAGGDWCHFAARVERSSLHRNLKSGELGHEDEKFSYVAFAKQPCPLTHGRVLRHPQKRTGHVVLTLCAEQGLIHKTISKKTPEAYKSARKAEWGDSFEF